MSGSFCCPVRRPYGEKLPVKIDMLVANVRIAIELAIHDFRIRYARSIAGPLWLVLTPAGLLGVYGLVFGVILGVRWPQADGQNPVGFVVPFFCGLLTFIYFSDVLGSSSNLFISKRNFVKKSPFPIWVIWLSNFIRCTIQGAIYVVFLFTIAGIYGMLTVSGLAYALLALIPIVLMSATFSVLLAALGPFVGDLSEAIRIVLRLLFYGAPVTYPLSLVPAQLHFILWVNPLTHMIEPLRNAIVYGRLTYEPAQIAVIFSAAVLLGIFWWGFTRVSRAIPDVI